MATASLGAKPEYLRCPVCDESYDEKDHLPKGFPCQHCVCMTCLEEIIKRCNGSKVACPMCRHAVPIPQSKAAGFPNNLAVMDMLATGQPEGAITGSTCTKHNKIISGFCLTCHETVCVMCMLKSPQHKGHDMEELSEVMEKCIGQSAEVVSDIVHTCSLIQEDIKQMSTANNPECLKILYQLKNCQSDIRNTASTASATNSSKPLARTATNVPDEHRVELVPTLSQVDVLPTANLPVKNGKLELLTSAKLPRFKHIDMNRRNKLLLVFPHRDYAVYKIDEHKFCKVKQPPLSGQSTELLNVAEHVILSENNKLVMQNEFVMMCNNKGYDISKRYMCKVHVFKRNWIALTQLEGSDLKCVFIQEKDQKYIKDNAYPSTVSAVRSSYI